MVAGIIDLITSLLLYPFAVEKLLQLLIRSWPVWRAPLAYIGFEYSLQQRNRLANRAVGER
jgi:hypothetical protein